MLSHYHTSNIMFITMFLLTCLLAYASVAEVGWGYGKTTFEANKKKNTYIFAIKLFLRVCWTFSGADLFLA